jgi:hypothetical protein
MIVHAITYFIAGALAYEFITKQFYQGDMPTFAFMRSESDSQQWSHVMTWMLPGQLLRGALMGLVLLPFMGLLMRMPLIQKGFVIAALYFVFSHLAAAGPTPSNIEGFIYFKPEFFSAKTFFYTQPEIAVQSLGLGFLFAAVLAMKGIRTQLEPSRRTV